MEHSVLCKLQQPLLNAINGLSSLPVNSCMVFLVFHSKDLFFFCSVVKLKEQYCAFFHFKPVVLSVSRPE